MVRKAVIPTAGFGTRFLPATKSMPKEMFPIINKPIIQFVVEEALDAGIENFVFITGRHKRPIEHHFDINRDLEEVLKNSNKLELLENVKKISHLINPIYIRQKEPKGLGDAVLVSEPVVGDEPFIVSLPDVIVEGGTEVLKKMIEIFNRFGKGVVALYEVPEEEVSSYGIAKVKEVEEDVLLIEDLVEKPSLEEAPSNLAIVGRYLFTPKIFKKLRETKPGKGGEVQLTDAMRKLLEEEALYAYKVKSKVYDTGTPLGYIKTLLEFALKEEDIRGELEAYLRETLLK